MPHQAPTRTRRRARAASTLTAALLLTLMALAAGCTHVSPYEREYLAKPGMDPGERERQAEKFYAHVFDAREAATGTTDSAGGGCGCN